MGVEIMKSFIKTLFWLLKKSAFGFVAFYAFNFTGSFIGIELGSSYFAYFLIGALGAPGLILVYLTNLLFII